VSFDPAMLPDRVDLYRKRPSGRSDTGQRKDLYSFGGSLPCSVQVRDTTPQDLAVLASLGVLSLAEVFFDSDPGLSSGDVLDVHGPNGPAGPPGTEPAGRKLRVDRCQRRGLLDLVYWRADCTERRP
jgi:hypothetical protein